MAALTLDCGPTLWTKTSRWRGSPNHHWLWKLRTGLQATWILCLSTRDAPIAIFLADSDFFGSVACRYRFLQITIFFLRTIIDSIYKQKYMQISTKTFLHNIQKLLKITIPPIWTNLQILSHLNNSQNKVLHDWKEEKIVNLKWVAVCCCNKTCHFPLFTNGHFFPPTLKNYNRCISRVRDIISIIYWNSNVNILIFWDTDFSLSFAISSNHQN